MTLDSSSQSNGKSSSKLWDTFARGAQPFVVAAIGIGSTILGFRCNEENRKLCVPNQYGLCTTTDSLSGYQICNADGRSFGECKERGANNDFTLSCPSEVNTFKVIVFGTAPAPTAANAGSPPRVDLWVKPHDAQDQIWTQEGNIAPDGTSRRWHSEVRLGNPYGLGHYDVDFPLRFTVYAGLRESGVQTGVAGQVKKGSDPIAALKRSGYAEIRSCEISRTKEKIANCATIGPRIEAPKPRTCTFMTDGELYDRDCNPADPSPMAEEPEIKWSNAPSAAVSILGRGGMLPDFPKPNLHSPYRHKPPLAPGVYEIKIRNEENTCETSAWFQVGNSQLGADVPAQVAGRDSAPGHK